MTIELKLLTRADIPSDAITVSPSQMSTWYRCRYAWKLSKLELNQLDQKIIGAANLGTIYHKFQQFYYGKQLGRQVALLNEMGQQKALEFAAKDSVPDANFYRVFAIFLAYTQFAAEHEEIIPLGAEVECFADTGLVSRDGRKIYLHGFIDLIGELFGKLILNDHKSHTNRPWSKSRLFYDHQLIFYWLLLELQDIKVDGVCVTSSNLWIPSKEKDFHRFYTINTKTKEKVPRFERFWLTEKDVKLQFYLDQFLSNIKQMWCDEPSYPMRLSSDCQFCSFKEHIELDARGQGEMAAEVLRIRHGKDIDLVDDTEEDPDDF